MKLKTVPLVAAWLCLTQPIYGLSHTSSATQSAAFWVTSQTTSPASAKRYKLGETIQLREGLTLKTIPGTSKSIELFASKLVTTGASLVLDLEFEVKPPAGGEVVAFELGESVGKSDVFLNAGEDKVVPRWCGEAPNQEENRNRPMTARVEDGLHFMRGVPAGKVTLSFLFELTGDQLKQKKILTLNFTMLPKEHHSLVIDLDGKGN